MTAAEVETKRCTGCGHTKAVTEFRTDPRSGKGGRKLRPQSRCIRCENTTPKPFTDTKLIRNRARHRAIAILVSRYQAELDALIEEQLPIVRAEAEAVTLTLPVGSPAVPAGSSVARLKPGRRPPEETVVDRADVGRCPHCGDYHDRGHVCHHCKQRPGELSVPARAAVVADVLRLLALGRRPAHIAEVLGYGSAALLAGELVKAGRPDLAERMRR